MKRFSSCSPLEETEHEYEILLQSERSVYDEPQIFSPSYDQTPSSQTFHKGQLFSCPVNGKCPAPQSECGDNREGRETHQLKGGRKKRRKTSNLCNEGRENITSDEDVNDGTVEGGDTCPVQPKRMKETDQVENHLRIHTGEKL